MTTEQVVLDPFKHKLEDVAEMFAKAYSREGVAIYLPKDSLIGMWATDNVSVIVDYDASHLFDASKGFTNITRQVVKEWNQFVGLGSHHLSFTPCGCTKNIR